MTMAKFSVDGKELDIFAASRLRPASPPPLTDVQAAMRTEHGRLKAEVSMLSSRCDHLEEKLTACQKTNDELMASASWRLTAPFRAIKRLFRPGVR